MKCYYSDQFWISGFPSSAAGSLLWTPLSMDPQCPVSRGFSGRDLRSGGWPHSGGVLPRLPCEPRVCVSC